MKRVLSLFLALIFSAAAGVYCPTAASFQASDELAAEAEIAKAHLKEGADSVFALELLETGEPDEFNVVDIRTAVKLNHDGMFLTLLSNLDRVLTLAQQVKTNRALRLYKEGMEEPVFCDVLLADKEADLCLLKVADKDLAAVKPYKALPLLRRGQLELSQKLIHFHAVDPLVEAASIATGAVLALKPKVLTESGLLREVFESDALIVKTAVSGLAFNEKGEFLGLSLYMKERNAADRNAYFMTAETLELCLWRMQRRLGDRIGDRPYLWEPLTEDEEDLVQQERAEEDQDIKAMIRDDLPVYLGLSFYEDDYYAALRTRFGFPLGLMIYGVDHSSPAYTAALSPQDILLKVNEVKVHSFEAFYNVLSELSSGEQITLEVWQNGVTREVKLYLKRGPGAK